MAGYMNRGGMSQNLPRPAGMPSVTVKTPGNSGSPNMGMGRGTGSGNPKATIVAKSAGKNGGAR